MKLIKVHHVALIVSDYKRSLRFYTDVLGLKVLSEHYRASRQSYKTDLALGDDYVLELFSFPNPPARVTNPEAAGLRHLSFLVENLDAAKEELESRGIPHEEVRVDEFTQKRFFFLKDPDGLPIEIYES